MSNALVNSRRTTCGRLRVMCCDMRHSINTISSAMSSARRQDRVRFYRHAAVRRHDCARPPRARPPARARRQVDLPSLCAAGGAGRGPLDARPIIAPGPTAGRRSPACAGSASRSTKVPTARSLYWDEASAASVRPRRRSTPATPARRCGCWRRAGRAALHQRRWSATRRCRAGRCAASSSRSSGWARGSTRPTAMPPLTIHGAPLHAIAYEPTCRAPRSRARCCSPACTPTASPSVTEPAADARPHRAGADGLRLRRSTSTG